MNYKRMSTLFVAIIFLLLVTSQATGQGDEPDTPQGTYSNAFTYQGQLKDAAGPVNGTCDLRFILWDAEISGWQVGNTLFIEGVELVDGLFTARLDFGSGTHTGDARWLEVAVSCPAGSGSYVPLSPRQELTGSPYALSAPWSGLVDVPGDLADGDDDTIYTPGGGLSLSGGQFSINFAGSGTALTASRSDHHHNAAYVNEGQANSVSSAMIVDGALLFADLNRNGCGTGQIIKWNGSAWACAGDEAGGGSFWSLNGNAGTTPGTHYLGTSDNTALVLKVNNTRALRIEPSSEAPNLIGGWWENFVTAGVRGATISGGGSGEFGENRVTDDFGTVGGGIFNQAGDGAGTTSDHPGSTVGGGMGNAASGSYVTISGGLFNFASRVDYATVSGGLYNATTSDGTTIGGGGNNAADGIYSTISGGENNHSSDFYGTIAGGYNNQAGDEAGTLDDSPYATVGGGRDNTASGENATVSGGRNNLVSGGSGAVGGGFENVARADGTFIGGGVQNEVTDRFGTVAGGFQNQAGDGVDNGDGGSSATVGGGRDNVASGTYSVVAGGDTNTASGTRSTVPGGVGNVAAGDHSFAAGRRAKANHGGAFVWADGLDADFASTNSNTFRVRATNGAEFVANNAGYGLIAANNGAGDGLRAMTNSSVGTNWAAVYAVSNGTSPAVYANSAGTYSGYFLDNIYVDGNCVGCTTAFVAINAGSQPLETGDLVSVLGVTDPLSGTNQPLLSVEMTLAQGSGVIGVVQSKAVLSMSEKEGPSLQGAQKADGEVASGEYLFIVVQGIANVKVDASFGAINPGDRLTAATAPGKARALQTREVDGMLVTEGAPVIGIALAAPESGSKLIPVFVNLQ